MKQLTLREKSIQNKLIVSSVLVILLGFLLAGLTDNQYIFAISFVISILIAFLVSRPQKVARFFDYLAEPAPKTAETRELSFRGFWKLILSFWPMFSLIAIGSSMYFYWSPWKRAFYNLGWKNIHWMDVFYMGIALVILSVFAQAGYFYLLGRLEKDEG